MQVLNYSDIKGNINTLEKCGGKGKNLFKLRTLGLDVPDFLIIGSESFESILSSHKLNIIKQLESITNDENENLIREVSGNINQIIQNIPISDDIIHLLLSRCKAEFGENYSVSVRSSALVEDGGKDSFAGQLDSFLFVKEEQLIKHILKCLASNFNSRVIKYRLIKNYAVTETSMAIIIQKMVPAVKSGVLFTMNVNGNMNEMVIAAAYGIGEGVVSDRSDTDTYFIDRQKKNIYKRIGKKETYLDFDEKAGTGVCELKVPESKRTEQVLSDKEITKLCEHAFLVEQQSGIPQDIEFAYDKLGKLFILQTRPITTIQFENLKILDNSNIIESYPHISLPLTFSYALNAYKHVFISSIKAFKISDKVIRENDDIFSNLLTHLNGRIYYNLHNWYIMIGLVLTSSESITAWENFIGIRSHDKKKNKAPLSKRLKTLVVTTKLLLNHSRRNKQFYRFFNNEYQKLKAFVTIIDQKAPKDIFNFYKERGTALFAGWAPTIINDFFTFKSHDYLMKFIASIGITEENITNDLLCGTEGVESKLPIIKLLEMKHQILHNKDLTELFKKPPDIIYQSLQQNNYQVFKQLFDNYINQFGDRTTEELKLEMPNLRMKPELLVQMIQSQINNTTTVESFENRQQSIRKQAEEIVAQKLKYKLFKRFQFYLILTLTRSAVKNRENMRFCRTRAYGTVKEMFLAIGRRMVSEDIIEQAEDVFYLQIKDLKKYSIDKNLDSHKEQIKLLKKEYKNLLKINLPDRIIYSGNLPDLDYYSDQNIQSTQSTIKGIAVSKGKITEKAIVLEQPSIVRKIEGEILVARMTDPGWIFLMVQAGGIVTEKGSLLSHTAIVGRELGIPVVVGVDNITHIVKTGEVVTVDGDKGVIEIPKQEVVN